MPALSTRRFFFCICAALLLLFSVHLGFGYILLDDDVHTYANPHYQSLTLASVAKFWTKPYFGMYIPMTYTVWALEVPFAKWLGSAADPQGFSARVFHFGNFLLHVLNCFLLWALCRKILQRRSWWDFGLLVAVGVFALHPVQVETVAWISGRRDLLATSFALTALYLSFVALGAAQGGSDAGERRRYWLLASLAFLASVLSKPAMVALPLVLGALVWVYRRNQIGSAVWAIGAWGLLALPVVGITKFTQPNSLLDFQAPLWFRPIVAMDALVFYLQKLLFPFPLGIDYGRSPKWLMHSGAGYYTAVFFFVVMVALVRARVFASLRWPAVFFVLALSPVLGFIPFAFQQFSTVADHYLYFPLCVLVLGLAPLPRTKLSESCVFAGLALCFVVSFFQTRQWASSEKIFAHTLEHYPASQSSANNLGYLREKQERLPEALALYQKALDLRPTWADAQYNVGNIHAKQGNFASAEPLLKQVLEQKPDHADAAHVLGLIYLNSRRAELAVPLLERAVTMDPNRPQFISKLAAAKGNLGDTLAAIELYHRAIELSPTFAEAHNNLGVTYQRMGQTDQAIKSYRNSVTLQPGYLQGRVNLATLLRTSGRCAEAVPHYEELQRRLPDLGDLKQGYDECLNVARNGSMDSVARDAASVGKQERSK